MSSEKTPEAQIQQEIPKGLAGDKSANDPSGGGNGGKEGNYELEKEGKERDKLQTKFTRGIILAQERYHFWRELLIPLMIIVPLVLLICVWWIIFMSEPIDCPKIGKCEDPGLWTKNIFVSGSFVTFVSFYIALAKGLFGDNIRDRSLSEQASDAAWSAAKASGG